MVNRKRNKQEKKTIQANGIYWSFYIWYAASVAAVLFDFFFRFCFCFYGNHHQIHSIIHIYFFFLLSLNSECLLFIHKMFSTTTKSQRFIGI